MFAKGLNGFRVRFAVLMGLMVSIILILDRWNDSWFPDALGQFAIHSLIILLAIVSVVLVYAFVGQITRPLQHLSELTQNVANGDLSEQVEIPHSRELAELSINFQVMVDRLRDNVERIRSMAFEDQQTGLPNRQAMDALLHAIQGRSGSVFVINLDRFKPVNETFGHEIGDQLLKAVGNRLASDVFGPDLCPVLDSINALGGFDAFVPDGSRMLFRFSGDEYVGLVVGRHTADELARLGETCVAAMGQPFELEGYVLQIGASVGICRFPDDTDDLSEAVTFSEMALDAAKVAGGGCIRFFDSSLQMQTNDRLELEADFRLALKRDELVVYYQPQVDLATGRVESVEALVRWQHPARGLLLPGRFLPIAQRTGLFQELSMVVFRKALEQAMAWYQTGTHLRVAVNISPLHFANPGFGTDILMMLSEVNAPGGLLELELTEDVAMQDPVQATQQLMAMRDAGVTISIDDFGTGHSNLAQLCELPFDMLKLDRSLILGIGKGVRGDTIVAALVKMARSLGITVLAEGVEEQSQMDFLVSTGCNLVQGYHVAMPMPGEAVMPWLAEHNRSLSAAA